jgi:carotenoid cleavage dioxygenase-like enzyme
MPAPVASGGSGRRAGLAPAGKRRLVTAHVEGRTFDEILRFDLARWTVAVHRFPGQVIGEAVFAPKAGRREEEAGYVRTFTTDLTTLQSGFVILDA